MLIYEAPGGFSISWKSDRSGPKKEPEKPPPGLPKNTLQNRHPKFKSAQTPIYKASERLRIASKIEFRKFGQAENMKNHDLPKKHPKFDFGRNGRKSLKPYDFQCFGDRRAEREARKRRNSDRLRRHRGPDGISPMQNGLSRQSPL